MYKFISAALSSNQETPVGIYVKYGHFPDEMKLIEQTTNITRLQLPDRLITVVNDNHKSSGTRIYDWDEYVPLSPFHKTMNAYDSFSDISMINYVEHYGKMEKSNASCKKGCIPNRTKIVCDSGGFQIAVQRVKYIDPKNLAKFYNENADWGIVLDIPLYRGIPDDLLIKAAKTQKKNTRILLDNIDDSVELINVCHGYTMDKYDKYLEITTVPEVDRLCIGGLYLNNLASSLALFIHLVEKWKSHYKHFHILGIYNVSILSCFIYLAEKVFPDVLVTSDASTPVQSARSGLYHFQREYDKPMERLVIGCLKNKLNYFNKHRLLPCSCPVCKALKYMDVFSFIMNNPLIRCLTIHNTFEVNRSIMGIQTLAHNTSFEQYRDTMMSILATHINKKDAKRGFDFIQLYLEEGLDKAEKVFQTQNYQGVFDTFSSGVISNDEDMEIETYTSDDFKKHLEEVFKLYNTPGAVETFKTIKSRNLYN